MNIHQIVKSYKDKAIQLSMVQRNHISGYGWRLEQPFEAGTKAWLNFGIDSDNVFLYDQCYYLLRNEVGDIMNHSTIKAIFLKELNQVHHL